jgi:hypothetical protein
MLPDQRVSGDEGDPCSVCVCGDMELHWRRRGQDIGTSAGAPPAPQPLVLLRRAPVQKFEHLSSKETYPLKKTPPSGCRRASTSTSAPSDASMVSSNDQLSTKSPPIRSGSCRPSCRRRRATKHNAISTASAAAWWTRWRCRTARSASRHPHRSRQPAAQAIPFASASDRPCYCVCSQTSAPVAFHHALGRMCLCSFRPVLVLTLLRGSGRRPFLVFVPCMIGVNN